MATLNKVNTSDKNLQILQDNIDKVLNQNPMGNGVVLGTPTTPISLAIGSNTFAHGLGRVPQYWTLLDLSAASTVYRTAWTATTISLTASAACNILLWLA